MMPTGLRAENQIAFTLINNADTAKEEDQHITQSILHSNMIMCLDRLRSSSGAFFFSLFHVHRPVGSVNFTKPRKRLTHTVPASGYFMSSLT